MSEIEITNVDPGEGSPLPADKFLGVYGEEGKFGTEDIKDGAITTPKLAKNAVKSDNVDWTTTTKTLHSSDGDWNADLVMAGIINYVKWGHIVYMQFDNIHFVDGVKEGRILPAGKLPKATIMTIFELVSHVGNNHAMRMQLHADGSLYIGASGPAPTDGQHIEYNGTVTYISKD